jgi:hypothetical protein
MQPASIPRVALFTESFDEADGVARMATALEAFAAARDLPLLVVHGGRATELVESGSIVRLEVARSRRCAIALEGDRRFDLALWRHRRRVAQVLRWFRPDVLHFTGPSDVGVVGAFLGRRERIPMVGSWHQAEARVPQPRLSAKLWLCSLASVVLAPNEASRQAIEARLKTPALLLPHGADALYDAYDVAIALATRGVRAIDGAVATIPMKQSA